MTSPQWSVLLIGAGELGSRHLQSLASLSCCRIDVVEPSESAQALAKQRLLQVTANAPVHFFSSSTQIATHYDVAIVATGASIRFEVASQLLQQVALKFLILEKVLFQQAEHYERMSRLLKKSTVQVYVNCPRRLFPLYQQFKEELPKSPMNFNVSGNLWGMACNSIHFIDLIAFLTGETLLHVDGRGLNRTFSSKRAGYLEIEGQLLATFSNGSTLNLNCTADVQQALTIQLRCHTRQHRLFIDEQQGLIQNMVDGSLLLQGLPMLYQSQLTASVVNDLRQQSRCGLTSFSESVLLHQPLLATLLDFFRQEQPLLDFCPIT